MNRFAVSSVLLVSIVTGQYQGYSPSTPRTPRGGYSPSTPRTPRGGYFNPTTPSTPVVHHGNGYFNPTTPRSNQPHVTGGVGFAKYQHPFPVHQRSPFPDHYNFMFEHPQPVYKQRPYHPPVPCDPVAARVDFLPGVNDRLQGALLLRQDCPGGSVIITGILKGLEPGLHGLHIHEKPSLSDQCAAAGGHYNPFDKKHGDRTRGLEYRHVGDLGNIEADTYGVAHVHIIDNIISLHPSKGNVVGRAMVVHTGEDDLGLGGDESSKKTGNAGKRAGCGIIAPNNNLCSIY